ncbi:MAG: hypothetical protein IBX41_05430 [Methanophagales archaeon]|nr:hypothetical protein [Methanophagales archaeon]
MEVITIEKAQGSRSGKYDEKKLLEAVKKALKEGEKTGKMAGFKLKAFIEEVYTGEKPNLGALRKKVQEIGWKHNLGDVKVTIKEKDDLIGFYLQK